MMVARGVAAILYAAVICQCERCDNTCRYTVYSLLKTLSALMSEAANEKLKQLGHL